ncbi:WxL protein peptidoglycan domain-containing protein [Glycomyces sp. NRRL B-16210]|uniref:WxL protein peptidoglycan domain-containing protein n=1 Tax=Glycomyces sp. NRRL B-16210 TaxID=1463821 RepID=UPI000689ED64|nr:DUF916 domain-containing protein [Glycomyces sp. NRRL B-16210]
MRTTLIAAASALAVLLCASPAAAQEDEAAPATWGVNPSGQDGPDGRAAFDYALDPGETLIDFVGVSNFSTEPITLRLYASDAYTTETGAFDLLPSGTAPIDVGSWIGFNEQELTVEPQTRLDVPFALTVPADATPGDHVGGIVAALTEEGEDVLVERRVGARIHLRVSGDLDPNLTPDADEATYHYVWNPAKPGSLTFDYEVANRGNVRLQGELVARVGGPWDVLAREHVIAELPQILPGDTFAGTAELEGVWPLLHVEVDLIVRPEAVDPADVDSRLPTRTDESAVWAPPWTQLAVAVLLAFALWLTFKLRARKRRKAAARSGEPRPDPEPEKEPVEA